jgi:RNA-directed DNA polymerase
VKDKDTENNSAAVPMGAKQAEDIRGRWPWVKRCVWSERMLWALENGIKGGKWFSLIDKVWKMDNLWDGWSSVMVNGGSPGVDGQTIPQFNQQVQGGLERLRKELLEGSYQPQPVRRVWIPKMGSKELRPLGVPAVRDRIVQSAIRNVIEPIFERIFAEHSYGFRPGRGCKEALGRVNELLSQGKTWVVDVDLKSYFDTIPQERLLARIREQVADGRLLQLLEKYLKAGVLDGLKGWQPTESGTPQGSVISPIMANLYLNPLDHLMAGQGYEMTRYADDFVVQCRTQAEAEAALELIRQWSRENGLTVHPIKTRIVDATHKGGFDFLGYHFERGMKWPREKSMEKFRDSIRNKTRRTQGRSMTEIIAELNPTMRGWYEYFQDSHWNVFKPVDGWVRMRLRSILRKWQGKKGRGRGNDHQKWTNAYFDRLGLFCLERARGLVP